MATAFSSTRAQGVAEARPKDAPALTRVLLVDDDREEWLIVRSLLRAGGNGAGEWMLDWVSEGASALEIIGRAEHDAYLIDYHLGIESGLELVERAVAAGCEAPLILLTGQDDPRVDERAMRAGATDYLLKEGLGSALLERTLRYAIAGKATERELRRVAAQNAVLLAAVEGADVGVILTAPGTPGVGTPGVDAPAVDAGRSAAADPVSLVTYVNPAFTRITGYQKSDILGEPMPSLRGPQTELEALRQMRQSVEAGAICDLTTLNYRRDGTPFWNEVQFGPVRDAAGHQLGRVGFLKDVTARVEAEHAVREARLNLETAQAVAHLGSWSYEVLDAQNHGFSSAFWSDETYRILGLEPGAVTGTRQVWAERVHPDDRAWATNALERAVDGFAPYDIECRVVRPDGELRHVQARAEVERDEAGQPRRVVGTLLDITERKRAELAERALETRMRAVTDVVPLILWAIDKDGIFTLSQGRTLAKLGLGSGEVVGHSLFDLYRDNPRVSEACRRALAGEECEEILEVRGRTFAVYMVPQFDGAGEQFGVAGVSYDITDQFYVRQALRESEERFARIVPNVPGMVYRFVRDAQGHSKFLFVSEGCREIYGVEPAAILADARELLNGVVPGEQEEFRRSIEVSARDLSPWEVELNIVRRDGGRRYVRGQARPVRGENGETIWDGVVLDMTQSKRAQDALEVSRRALDDAQELAHVGSFSYNVVAKELEWSREMYRIFGVAPDWKAAYPEVLKFYHPDDREATRARIERVMETGEKLVGMPRIIRGDGAVRWVDSHTRVERDQSGRVVRVVGSLQDVTERLEAERALRESEERYALAARGTNDGLWDWNLETDVAYFSPRWKNMIGCDEEIRDHMNEWFDRVHPEDIEHLRHLMGAHLHGHSAHFECEYRLRCGDGSYRWMLGRGLALLDAKGRALRLTGSQTDISQRKRDQERLERHAYYDSLTGLPNRKLFQERLEHTIARGNRQPDLTFAVLFLDIDRFKKINDSLGHLPGDRLLIEAAQRFEQCLRPGDTVGPFGRRRVRHSAGRLGLDGRCASGRRAHSVRAGAALRVGWARGLYHGLDGHRARAGRRLGRRRAAAQR